MAPKLRIAMICHRFPVLSQTFVIHQVQGLVDAGHTVEIFPKKPGDPACLRPEHRPLLDRICWGQPVTHPWVKRFVGNQQSRNLASRALKYLPSRARGITYDAVFAQFGTDGLRALRLMDAGHIAGPLTTVFRGFDLSKFIRTRPGVYDSLFARGALFLPVSRYFANRLEELGCDPQKIQVMRTGLPLERFPFSPRTRSSQEPLHAATVSRLVEKKGVEYGLRAMRLLLDGGANVQYSIIGEGPLKNDLVNLSRSLSLGSAVKFLGALPHEEVLRHLDTAHLLLSPSVTARDGDQEGLTTTIKEAAALGIPVVATRHAGVPELIVHQETGLLAPERDAPALAQQIDRLGKEPELCLHLGRNARKCIEADYDASKQILKLSRQLGSLSGNSREELIRSTP